MIACKVRTFGERRLVDKRVIKNFKLNDFVFERLGDKYVVDEPLLAVAHE